MGLPKVSKLNELVMNTKQGDHMQILSEKKALENKANGFIIGYYITQQDRVIK